LFQNRARLAHSQLVLEQAHFTKNKNSCQTYACGMRYVTMAVKGQITVPVEIRRALGLAPGKKLNISLKGEDIVIQKPVALENVRQALRDEMKSQGTGGVETESGAGWSAHLEGQFGSPASGPYASHSRNP
jgi:AbrB family looped-hinge helix DNA binding protein